MLCSLSGVSTLMIQSHTYYTGINRLYSGLLWPCYSGKIQKMSFSSFPVSTVNEFFFRGHFFFYAIFLVGVCWFHKYIYVNIRRRKTGRGVASQGHSGMSMAKNASCVFDVLPNGRYHCKPYQAGFSSIHFHFWKCLSSTFLSTKREFALSLDTLPKVRTFSLSRVKF